MMADGGGPVVNCSRLSFNDADDWAMRDAKTMRRKNFSRLRGNSGGFLVEESLDVMFSMVLSSLAADGILLCEGFSCECDWS